MIFAIGGIIAALLVFTTMIKKKITGIAVYARNAGFSGADLLTAVAIALAESGGNPNDEGDWTLDGSKLVPKGTPGAYSTSAGLWQIHWTVHPEFQGQNLYDPQTNANAAYSVYRAAGNSFRPWTTYLNGAYTAHLDEAGKLVNA